MSATFSADSKERGGQEQSPTLSSAPTEDLASDPLAVLDGYGMASTTAAPVAALYRVESDLNKLDPEPIQLFAGTTQVSRLLPSVQGLDGVVIDISDSQHILRDVGSEGERADVLYGYRRERVMEWLGYILTDGKLLTFGDRVFWYRILETVHLPSSPQPPWQTPIFGLPGNVNKTSGRTLRREKARPDMNLQSSPVPQPSNRADAPGFPFLGQALANESQPTSSILTHEYQPFLPGLFQGSPAESIHESAVHSQNVPLEMESENESVREDTAPMLEDSLVNEDQCSVGVHRSPFVAMSSPPQPLSQHSVDLEINSLRVHEDNADMGYRREPSEATDPYVSEHMESSPVSESLLYRPPAELIEEPDSPTQPLSPSHFPPLAASRRASSLGSLATIDGGSGNSRPNKHYLPKPSALVYAPEHVVVTSSGNIPRYPYDSAYPHFPHMSTQDTEWTQTENDIQMTAETAMSSDFSQHFMSPVEASNFGVRLGAHMPSTQRTAADEVRHSADDDYDNDHCGNGGDRSSSHRRASSGLSRKKPISRLGPGSSSPIGPLCTQRTLTGSTPRPTRTPLTLQSSAHGSGSPMLPPPAPSFPRKPGMSHRTQNSRTIRALQSPLTPIARTAVAVATANVDFPDELPRLFSTQSNRRVTGHVRNASVDSKQQHQLSKTRSKSEVDVTPTKARTKAASAGALPEMNDGCASPTSSPAFPKPGALLQARSTGTSSGMSSHNDDNFVVEIRPPPAAARATTTPVQAKKEVEDTEWINVDKHRTEAAAAAAVTRPRRASGITTRRRAAAASSGRGSEMSDSSTTSSRNKPLRETLKNMPGNRGGPRRTGLYSHRSPVVSKRGGRAGPLTKAKAAKLLPPPLAVSKPAGDGSGKEGSPVKRMRTRSGRASHRNLGLGSDSLQSGTVHETADEAGLDQEEDGAVRLVAVTGLQGDERIKFERQLEINGLSVTENPLLSDVCIREGKLGRTLKVLCALARGTPIVTPSWVTELSSTIKAKMSAKDMRTLLDHHLLNDPMTEDEWGMSVARTLAKARGRLMARFCVLISDEVEKPDPVCLGVMVRAAGGALFNEFGIREQELLEGSVGTQMTGRRRSAGISPAKSASAAGCGLGVDDRAVKMVPESSSSSSSESEPDDDEDEDWNLDGNSRNGRLGPRHEGSMIIAPPPLSSAPTTPVGTRKTLTKRCRPTVDESPSMATTPVAGHSVVPSSELLNPSATEWELKEAIAERYRELGIPVSTRLVVVTADPDGLRDRLGKLSYAVVEPEAIIQSIIKCKVQF